MKRKRKQAVDNYSRIIKNKKVIQGMQYILMKFKVVIWTKNLNLTKHFQKVGGKQKIYMILNKSNANPRVVVPIIFL